MKTNSRTGVLPLLLGYVLCLMGLGWFGDAWAAETDAARPGRVEVVLAAEYRKDGEAIKQDFVEAGLANVHLQFMKQGQPPPNIGVGREVTAERARTAIRLAKKYNRGVTILLPTHLFPPHYVTIASSSFDDTVECAIQEDELRQLEDPALTTEQFHDLYRQFTVMRVPASKKGRVF